MLGLSSQNRTCEYRGSSFTIWPKPWVLIYLTVARVGIFIWSTVECAVTIMAASIPIMRILVIRVCRRNRHQVSNQPLRRLRTISTRNKRASANVTIPSDDAGAPAVTAREEGLSSVTLIPSIDSNRRNDIDMYTIDRTLSLV
jgi:hypothetical protein